MKFKNIVRLFDVISVCIDSWNVINDDNKCGSLEEKDLIATLPEDITVFYCIDNSGEKILNDFEVKKLTIDRQHIYKFLIYQV